MSELSNSVAAAQLRAFIERIERVEEDIRDLNADKSEIYKEARGVGYDVKTMRKVVAARKMDAADRQEADALFDTYMAALGMLPEEQPSRVHVHEGNQSPRPTSLETSSAGVPSPTSGERDLVEVGTGQNSAVLPQEPYTADFEPPAFIKRTVVLRPHCLNPGLCASGFPSEHCHACKKAMEANEVAA